MKPLQKTALLLLAAALVAAGWTFTGGGAAATGEGTVSSQPPAEGLARATFAGGCFWCMEPPFDKIDGVVSTISGYTGGAEKNPSYKEVAYGRTGHTEALQITYDPEKVSYEQLLEVFWRNHDPLTGDRQFCDRGQQYRPGIFFHDEQQKAAAVASRNRIADSGRFSQPIVTEITALDEFWIAEDYHQDYYEKNPLHYKQYRYGCGRDQRLRQLWGSDS
ncbi:MAG: peptide-methionine (S)-S-oxide reductase MsrA [Acidobacteriota bacterium]